MREKRKPRKRERAASIFRSRLDVSQLLLAAQNGVEDAEFLLNRAAQRNEAAPNLGSAWSEACYAVEQLDELRASGALQPLQEQHFTQFQNRIERLLPLLRKRGFPEPRIAWDA